MAGLLVLHAVRLKGFGDEVAVAGRFGLEVDVAAEFLLDSQAFGWVAWSEFAGSRGWSLTEAGRAENARQLAAELDQVGGRAAIQQAYSDFLPLNGRLQQACTDWQLRPTASDALAFNDHTDLDWDQRVVDELGALGDSLRKISEQIGAVLERLDGYDDRFAAALSRVRAGDGSWVDRTGADSCHTVWFELHEDLIATLGLTRGTH
ncbi:transcriptional regulator [Kribbella ginsengisoli]|uniref:Transcriptional regulator n=1 Tax=Kribbella ginsengisoli TaxID=363865 RepID=A0ABP6XQU3_9ACTN